MRRVLFAEFSGFDLRDGCDVAESGVDCDFSLTRRGFVMTALPPDSSGPDSAGRFTRDLTLSGRSERTTPG